MSIPHPVIASLAVGPLGAWLEPTFIAVVALTVLSSLVLYTDRPPVSRRTVAAMVPWMVLAGALSVLATVLPYPSVMQPAVSGVGAYLTTYILLGLAWFASRQFVREVGARDPLPVVLAAMGTGAVVVVGGVTLAGSAGIDPSQLVWLAIAPIAAAGVGGLVLLLLGLWYPEAAAYTGMAGAVVVFGHTLAAIATAVAVTTTGHHTLLSWAVWLVAESLAGTALVRTDPTVLWAGGVIWLRLVVATAAVVALTAYTRRRPHRGNLILGGLAAIGVVGGTSTLLAMVVTP